MKELGTIRSIKDETQGIEDGYLITTDQGYIWAGISNYQDCCENWGYMASHDDFEDFLGSDVLSVRVVDEALNVSVLKDNDLHEGDCIFVNIETNKGTLQFTIYNVHNGYYGHAVTVKTHLEIIEDACL